MYMLIPIYIYIPRSQSNVDISSQFNIDVCILTASQETLDQRKDALIPQSIFLQVEPSSTKTRYQSTAEYSYSSIPSSFLVTRRSLLTRCEYDTIGERNKNLEARNQRMCARTHALEHAHFENVPRRERNCSNLFSAGYHKDGGYRERERGGGRWMEKSEWAKERLPS